MSRTNVRKDIDPDWGNQTPPVDSVFSVNVNSVENGQYSFYILMPIITDPEIEELALQNAMDQLLDQGDEVDIKGVSPADSSKFNKSTIIATFDVDEPDIFYFLTPPPHLRH